MSSVYHTERKLLQTRNGKLHYHIWRLAKERETEDQVSTLKMELWQNTVRMRTLDHLIKHDTESSLADDTPCSSRP